MPHDRPTDLSHLIRFCVLSVALQDDPVSYALLARYVMASPCALHESQPPEQTAQVVEADSCV